MYRRWIRRLTRSPEGARRLVRRFVKLHLQDVLRPDRSRRRSKPKKHAPGAPFDDDRSVPRRVASRVKASIVRSWRLWRKRLWEFVKWVIAWRLRPLKGVVERGRERGFVVLDHKRYRPDLFSIRRDTRSVHRKVSRLLRTKEPIVVGPWISEIGFELLYWIPFLYWAKAYGKLATNRLWVLSRGGTASWYRHLSPNYLEIFEYVGPEEFRARNAERIDDHGGLKQHGMSPFDEELLDWAQERIGAYRHHVLHPSLMYQLYRPYFLRDSPARLIEQFGLFRRIHDGPAEDPPSWLPEEYVAVKLYANLALEAGARTAKSMRRILEALTSEIDVVVLETGYRYDDHTDLPWEGLQRVHDLRGRVYPQNNLDVQTQVIRNARTFYCTYGGFSYLAPLCGVPTVTFFSKPKGFKPEHLEIAQRVFGELGCPPFVALNIAHLDVLDGNLAFLFE